jgi:hypothetical protein
MRLVDMVVEIKLVWIEPDRIQDDAFSQSAFANVLGC